MDQKHFSVSGVVVRDEAVLLVRHTYGPAKGMRLIPGGHVRAGEMPRGAIEREVREETGVKGTAGDLVAARYRPSNWWSVFYMAYEGGEPAPDGREVDWAAFMPVDELLDHPDVTEVSKLAVRACVHGDGGLARSGWAPEEFAEDEYDWYCRR